MKKKRKSKLITPFFTLLAGAITVIILTVRGVEFMTLLLTLLIVVLVFYVIGDVIRYIYESIQPRVIAMDESYFMIDENGLVVERKIEQQQEGENSSEDETESANQITEEAESEEGTFAEEELAEDDEYSEEDLAEDM